MKTLCLHSTKGGTGKSFVSQNLAYGLQRLGKKVLCIDLDQQGSLTGSLLGKQEPNNIARFFILGEPLQNLVCQANPHWGNVAIIPGGVELATAAKHLLVSDLPARELILDTALQEISSQYDFCLIDCPPSRDVLVFNAFAAATHVYIPVQPSLYDSQGLAGTAKLVSMISSMLHKPVQVGGIIQNRWGRDRLAKDIAKQLNGLFPSHICKSVIPDSVRAREAISAMIPLATHAPAIGSPIVESMNHLVLEIMSHGSENRSTSAA